MDCECFQPSCSSTKVDSECPKSQCKSSGPYKPRMRHKSEGKHHPLHVRCPTPSTFAGPWIPPPGRTTRGTKYGWQVHIEWFTSVTQYCNVVYIDSQIGPLRIWRLRKKNKTQNCEQLMATVQQCLHAVFQKFALRSDMLIGGWNCGLTWLQ